MATKITYTIPTEQENAFKIPFLEAHPIPIDDEGNPLMTYLEWIGRWGYAQFRYAVDVGERTLKNKEIVVPDDLITTTVTRE